MDKTYKNKLAIQIGENLKKLRNQRGFTKETLAEELDVSSSYLGQVERGKYLPSLSFLIKVSQYYNTGLDCLLFTCNEDTQDRKATLNNISVLINTFDEDGLKKIESIIRVVKELFY